MKLFIDINNLCKTYSGIDENSAIETEKFLKTIIWDVWKSSQIPQSSFDFSRAYVEFRRIRADD